jgi:hypothetical protein
MNWNGKKTRLSKLQGSQSGAATFGWDRASARGWQRAVNWTEAWRQFALQLRNASSTSTKLQPHTAQQPQIRINSKLARESPRRRRARVNLPHSNLPSLKPARISQTILDTPRRSKLLADTRVYAGKMPRKELFKIHNITERTGYYI